MAMLEEEEEIWGSCTKISRRQTQTLDMIYGDFHAEKLHLKYCKYILCVHTKASKLATIGELGRFPIYNDICESISKFHLHVQGTESESLLNQSLQTSIQLHNDDFKSCYSGVETILNEIKLDELNICLIKNSLKYLNRNIWSKEEAVIK